MALYDGSCSLDWKPEAFDCYHRFNSSCQFLGFDFATLTTITSFIGRCADDDRLFDKDFIKREACEGIVGSRPQLYDFQTVWTRLATWKFPLFQLIAVFPRPPLGFRTQCFVVFHMLGDPISTLCTLISKKKSCQDRAHFWRGKFRRELSHLVRSDESGTRSQDEARLCRRLAIIIDSYDEYGHDKGGQSVGSAVQTSIFNALLPENNPSIIKRRAFLDTCILTAQSLAADRATNFLPVVIAQIIFISTVALAFARIPETASDASSNTHINLEVYAVAFSVQYFWILPATIWSSIIGVSQSSTAIPRILDDFRNKIKSEFSGMANWNTILPREHLYDVSRRKMSGGIYSWNSVRMLGFKRPSLSLLTAVLIVCLAVFSAFLFCYLVPPVGAGCRTSMAISIGGIWLFSAFLDLAAGTAVHLVPSITSHQEYAFTFAKDILLALATIACMFATVVGVFNSCECYTVYGRTGLHLPELPSIANLLQRSVRVDYVLVLVLIAFFPQLAITFGILWQYHSATRVFLQNDDYSSSSSSSSSSKMAWLHRIKRWIGALFARCIPSSRRDLRRQGTLSWTEANGGYEMPNLPPFRPHNSLTELLREQVDPAGVSDVETDDGVALSIEFPVAGVRRRRCLTM